MDTLSADKRSETMGRVRSKDTTAELIVRRLVHSLGFRYRLHGRELPGKPDIVFPARRKVIFVHGCFWHGHSCRSGRNRPASNQTYWIPKLDRNKTRDRANRNRLRRLGWDVLVIWECELKETDRLRGRIAGYLDMKNE